MGAQARESYEVGSRVGEWTLVRLLGEGGTALVFEGQGPGGARAAVKILSPALAAESTLAQRFVREGYIANGIDHPGVVRVLGGGQAADGTPYLVLELLDGETLDARRQRKNGRLPIDEVLWVADETLSVLAAAHARGVVHRDLKPENLFLTADGRIKVLDFGIARLLDASSTVMTRIGTVLGTLSYMAPEQARGSTDEIGVASDVWGVGATMFTLLAGRPVREDDSLLGLMNAGSNGVVSLAVVAPEMPASVVAVVDAALSFDPAVRWPSAAAMRRAVHVASAEVKHGEARLASGAPSSSPLSSSREPSYEQIRVRPSMQPPRISLHLSAPPPALPPPPRARLVVWGIAMVIALGAVIALAIFAVTR